MTDYRIEVDSIGEVKVPKNALYAAQTQRAVENFPISGMKPYPAFIWSIALIKRAAAEVNKDIGLLDAKVADAIIQAGDETYAVYDPALACPVEGFMSGLLAEVAAHMAL